MIRNIIFDFGGVLYDIDYNLTAAKFAELSKVKSDIITLDEMLEIPDKFERGLISESEFRNHLRTTFELIEVSDKDIDLAWNSMLIGLKQESIDFVKNIKVNFDVALLSNTNSIHYRKFHRETYELEREFPNVFFSHLINMRKPDMEIYHYVCNKCGFKESETLFIDDNLVNVKGAILANLKGYRCNRNGKLSDLYDTIKKITHT